MRRPGCALLPRIIFFLSLALTGTTAAVSISEKEILLQFKANISADPFRALASWDPANDPCHYVGVFCNSAGHVERILLWNTSLSGVLSPALSGLKSLRTISMFGNRFTGNIAPEFAGIKTLWKVNLSSNALSGSIPEFLGDLVSVRFLDLSRNGFTGAIPSALFRFCYRTRFVSLSHNRLSGPIPISLANCSNLAGLDLSFNHLSGGLPPRICDIPGLAVLSVGSNTLSGGVREALSGCRSLELLDLGSNQFREVAPFGVLGLKNLTHFNVSHNRFHGDCTQMGVWGERLTILDASVNDLEGEIPADIASHCGSLRLLDLSFNRLTGQIPADIINLKNLVVLGLGNNLIGWTIPVGFGSIELLEVLNLQNLKLVGQIPRDIINCKFLLELDVSGNALSGEIPQPLHNLAALKVLDLHGNNLHGIIPSSLGSLGVIEFLDLSQNLLSGPIPPSMASLTKLTHFNISYNNLSGRIPSIPIIQLFGPSAFSHNPGLCGSPLQPCSKAPVPLQKTHFLGVSVIIAIAAASLILTGVFAVSIVNVTARRKQRTGDDDDEALIVESSPLGSMGSGVIIGKLVLFSKALPSKYEDWEVGTKSLLDKECLIGAGSIGTVYKTSFEGGISIAVKKLDTLGRIGSQDEFEHEIARLGSLSHPNLTAFQGFYWSASMKLILSEFIPNGNLYDNLHGPKHPGTEMCWSRRFQIALGTARALAYLHHDCKPPVLHLNIKSTNILFDEMFRARLCDYGLGKLLPVLGNHGLTKSHSAVGYVAPELARAFSLSDKCDVYSFGVILLELVTGRKPVEGSVSNNEVVVLCELMRRMLEGGTASDCFDRSLQGGFVESELIQVMKLGLICTNEAPSRRPSMAEVVQVLESIRSGLNSH